MSDPLDRLLHYLCKLVLSGLLSLQGGGDDTRQSLPELLGDDGGEIPGAPAFRWLHPRPSELLGWSHRGGSRGGYRVGYWSIYGCGLS